jgi:hypothetical protein
LFYLLSSTAFAAQCAAVTSCNSLPDDLCQSEDEIVVPEIDWPVIVQGIAVYAQRQPLNVASELLESARAMERTAEEQDR